MTDPYGRPYPPPQPVVPVVPRAPTSGMSVASLVLGILGLVIGCCTFGIPSVLAVIFGHVGVNQTRAGANQTRAGAREGRGMAIAGLVMGYLGIAPAILLSVWFIFGAGLTAVTGVTSTSTP